MLWCLEVIVFERRFTTYLTLVVLATAVSLAAGLAPIDRGDLFGRVYDTLHKRYYDRSFRESRLPEIAARFREQAATAESIEAEREIVHRFLEEVPASHLQIISSRAHRSMFKALMNESELMWGFELIELDGAYFVHTLLEGGPAAKAGLMTGDRVLTMNGVSPRQSPLLDLRTDDAALPDPPIHAVLPPEPTPADADGVEAAGADDDAEHGRAGGKTEPPQPHRVRLVIQREADGPEQNLDIDAAEYAAFDAAKASIRVIDRGNRKIGYIHFWYIHMQGPDRLLAAAMRDQFSDCDALILDLRGRGGNAMMVPQILAVLEGRRVPWRKPVVALIDELTRSAKEAIAYEIRERDVGRLVGATTAGALLPATFVDVGEGHVLMYPGMKLPKYSDAVEGKGVPPHVEVAPLRRFNNGRDPILEAGIEEALRLIVTAPDAN